MLRWLTAAAALSLLVSPAIGAPCKDAKGKFTKCPPPVVKPIGPCKDAKGKFIKCPPPAAATATRCKDTKGKFIKCGSPGAKPV